MLDLSDKRKLYRIYNVPKSNGGFRRIYSPCAELKAEQVLLRDRLIKQYNPPDCVYGYIQGRNSSMLASEHVGKDWLITIDIENFFPSIRKMELLLLGLSEYESEIATYNDKCVQGSPCSPIISNMIMKVHDNFLCNVFKCMDVTYTRYSDDIQLSGNGKPTWGHIELIRRALSTSNFKINRKKVKFMFKNQRQEILGICVNDKISIDRHIRSQLKFRCKRNMLTEKDVGMLSYIYSVSKEQHKRITNV